MIQDQSESNSELGKDRNFYLSEEAGLTPLLAMTYSFEDCDWLVVQEGNKRALLRVGFIISLHIEITGVILPVLPNSLALTHIIYVYIFFFYHAVILKCCNRPKSLLLHSCIFSIFSIFQCSDYIHSGTMEFQHNKFGHKHDPCAI